MANQAEENQDSTLNDELIEVTLTNGERITAGVLLVLFTTIPLFIIIACWPNKINNSGHYQFKLFNVRLIDTCETDSPCLDKSKLRFAENYVKAANQNKAVVEKLKLEYANAKKKVETAAGALEKLKGRSPDSLKKPTLELEKANDSAKVISGKIALAQKRLSAILATKFVMEGSTIPLNSLLLLLVAAAGFLGNMIYISKSLTAFVGIGKFNRSWILWYVVKPFSASALAVIVYLAINDFPDSSAKINLNLIVAMAALTGLFTDIAMSKLKDIFEVIIKPNKDPVLAQDPKMLVHGKNIKPDKIDVHHPNDFTIPGVNLDAARLIVKMDDQVISNAVITPSLIKFTYTVAAADLAKTEFNLVITDKAKNELANIKLGV